MTLSPARSGMVTPSARSTPAVLLTSSDWSTPRTRDAPAPSAPSMSARCEMDLSPGTRRRPSTRMRRPAGASGSSEPRLERGGGVGLVVAILHDDGRLQRDPLLAPPPGRHG